MLKNNEVTANSFYDDKFKPAYLYVVIFSLLLFFLLPSNPALRTIISAAALLTFSIIAYRMQKSIFILLSVIFGTFFIFSVSDVIIGEAVLFKIHEFYQYRILLISISYLLLAYAFSDPGESEKQHWLSRLFYSLGSLGFLFSAFLIIIWRTNLSFMNIIFFVVPLGIIFLSGIYLKRKELLISGTLFFVIYIAVIVSYQFRHAM